MNLTNLKPTNSYVLPVEKDATDIKVFNNTWETNDVLSFTKNKTEYITLPHGRYKFIGTITKEGAFDFDVKKVIHADWFHLEENSEKYFISLLESNGVFLKNPMREKPQDKDFEYLKTDADLSNYEKVLYVMEKKAQWQSYEDKTLQDGMKFAVIEKIK